MIYVKANLPVFKKRGESVNSGLQNCCYHLSVCSGVLTDCDGTAFIVAPETPGGIEIADRVEAQQLQHPVSVRRTDTTLSIGDDVLIRCHANLGQHLAQLFCCLDYRYISARVKVDPFEVNRVGDVTSTLPTALV